MGWNVMRLSTCITALITVTAWFASPLAGADLAPYLGKWQVDVPATIETAKQSPKFNPAEHEKMAGTIERMLGSMTLTLDGATVTFARGAKFSESRPYVFKEIVDGVTTITVTQGEKSIDLSFTLDATQRLRLKSSASHDMDFYVWKRAVGGTGESPSGVEMMAAAMGGKNATPALPAKPLPTIEQNLKVILAGAQQYALEMGASAVTYDVLVKGVYFKPLQSVNGEDYATVAIDLKAGTASVKDKDGVVHSTK